MKATQITALKRIIKSAGGRSALEGVFFDNNGRACVCDGYRAIRLTERPEGLPTAAGVDLERIYRQNKPGRALWMPCMDELKSIIKESRARGEKIAFYEFSEGGPLVNARYLLDILTILPTAQAYESTTNPLISFIYFTSATGDAILCPIRKTK